MGHFAAGALWLTISKIATCYKCPGRPACHLLGLQKVTILTVAPEPTSIAVVKPNTNVYDNNYQGLS